VAVTVVQATDTLRLVVAVAVAMLKGLAISLS
jgi:hypothetical protein